MLKKEIEEVLDYIDGDFTADAHNSVEAVKIYPLRDVELALLYENAVIVLSQIILWKSQC